MALVSISDIAVGDIIKLNDIDAGIVSVNDIEWPSAPAGICGAQGGLDENFDSVSYDEQPNQRFIWSVVEDPEPDVYAVRYGALRYEQNTGATDYYRSRYKLRSKVKFAANTAWDFQIDYNIQQIDGRVNTEGPNIRLGCDRTQDPSGGESHWIQVQNSHVGVVLNCRTGYAVPNPFLAAQNQGKLRMAYDGNNQMFFYYDFGSGWVLLSQLQTDPYSTAGGEPYIQFESNGSLSEPGTMKASVDNYQVNIATPEDCSILTEAYYSSCAPWQNIYPVNGYQHNIPGDLYYYRVMGYYPDQAAALAAKNDYIANLPPYQSPGSYNAQSGYISIPEKGGGYIPGGVYQGYEVVQYYPWPNGYLRTFFLVGCLSSTPAGPDIDPNDDFESGQVETERWVLSDNIDEPAVTSPDAVPFWLDPNDDFETGALNTQRWYPQFGGNGTAPVVSEDYTGGGE